VTEPLAAIGLRVRAARHAAGMQQHELAERIGKSRGTVANLEAGRQDVTISTITKIAAALRVDASHLLGDGPTPALPAVTIRATYVVKCKDCGPIGEADDHERARKIRMGHLGDYHRR
jgi:HTH-type transcriptional regulator/antitoxin HipB